MSNQQQNSRRFSDKLWCLFGVHNYQVLRSGKYERFWDGELCKVQQFYDLRCACCGKVKGKIV